MVEFARTRATELRRFSPTVKQLHYGETLSLIRLKVVSLLTTAHDVSPSGLCIPKIQFQSSCDLLHQTTLARKRLPVEKESDPAGAKPDRQGVREPKAKAVKTIHQTFREACTEANYQYPRSTLFGAEMG
jgi:hypothetical protein